MPAGYLVSIAEREHEACARLIRLPYLSERLFGSLGLNPTFSWFILQMKKESLVSSMTGDVDIIGGRLDWSDPTSFERFLADERTQNAGKFHDSWNFLLAAKKLTTEGGIRWPPPTDVLIGIEAKCAYLDVSANQPLGRALKSTKSSPGKTRRMRRQVASLLEMGLDHAVLLDIIANPPVAGPDGGAWVTAAGLAADSMDAMSEILRGRLAAQSEAAHWVWSIGSVIGGDEGHRGTGSPIQLKASGGNSSLNRSHSTRAMRQQLEQRLTEILVQFPKPTGFPVIFLDCKSCGTIHSMSEPQKCEYL